MARSLNSNTKSAIRCSPSVAERVVEHQLGRLGAVAVAPGVLLADRDVVQRRAVVAVELAERARADQPVGRRARGWPSPATRCRRPARRRTARSRPARIGAVLVARSRAISGSAYQRWKARQVLRHVAAQRRPRSPRATSGNQRSRRHRRARYTIAAHAPLERARRARRGDDPDVREDRAARRLPARASTPDELPIAAVFLTGRPFPEADQRVDRPRLGGDRRPRSRSRRRRPRRRSARPTTASPTSSRRSGTCWRGRVTRPTRPTSPTLPEVAAAFAAIEAASGPAAKAALLDDLLARSTRGRRRGIVKVLGGELRIGLREGLLEAAIAKAFDRPLDAVKWAGMLTGDIGRTAELARDDRLDERRAGALPPAQVHARLARRGRRRDHHPARARRSGSRTSTTASAPSSTGRATDVRLYSRDLHDISGQFPEVVAAPAALPWDGDPRRRDPRPGGRRRAAVPQPPGTARPQGRRRRRSGRRSR